MMREKIRALIEEVMQEIFRSPDVEFSLSPPENPAHGDYASNIAFVCERGVAKQMNSHVGEVEGIHGLRTPRQFAEKIKGFLDAKAGDFIERIEIAGSGFINFFLSKRALQCALTDILAHPDAYGRSDIGKGKTVIVEYFQLNIAKRPHIGHIRSAIIGDALKRIFLSQGYRAVSDTHVGDWGTQFGILLLGYKEAGVRLHKQEVAEDPFGALEGIYGAENARIESDSARRELAKQEFAKLEQGDSENRVLWQWLVDVSMEKLKISAKRLNLLPFDEHRGESFYEDKMAPIAETALQKGIAEKTDDGAVVVDLTSEELDEAVLVKSDGASTYLLRDLATIKYRKERWGFWKNLYVVDVRQSHHFKQVFRVAELLGFEGAGQSQHIEYGFMSLPAGAISTRAGNVIALDSVLTEAAARARKVIAEKNPDLKNADEVARMVGLGALKYFDLSHHRRSDIVFRWDEALSFEGNTGPYLQYTYARLKSILRKLNQEKQEYAQSTEIDALEHRLLAMTLRLPEIIEDALSDFAPNTLANYMYGIAKLTNEFYHSHPVMQESGEGKKQFRMALVSLVALTLKKGLWLLGIEAPEEM